MAEGGQERGPPTAAEALADTLELYDIYICDQCRLVVGNHERHECKALLAGRCGDGGNI